MDICQVSEKPKYLEEPNDQNDHNDQVENLSDFAVHGNKCIDNPQKNSNNNDGN